MKRVREGEREVTGAEVEGEDGREGRKAGDGGREEEEEER